MPHPAFQRTLVRFRLRPRLIDPPLALALFSEIDKLKIESECPSQGIRGSEIQALKQTVPFGEILRGGLLAQPLGEGSNLLDEFEHSVAGPFADDEAQHGSQGADVPFELGVHGLPS